MPSAKPQSAAVAVALVLGGVALALLPAFFPAFFTSAPTRSAMLRLLGPMLALAVPAAAAAVAWRTLAALPGRRRRLLLLLLLALLAALLTEIHRTVVDESTYFGQTATNTDWQRMLQDSVLRRDPAVIPHSYRMLPNAFVAWLELLCGGYDLARWIYRFSFGLLLLAWIFRYASLWARPATALVAVLLYCAVYPVTIRCYAGQLTDPMSHLSFVLGLFALTTGALPLFVGSLAVGALAKESVVALLGLYLLERRGRERRFWSRLLFASSVCAAVLLVARLGVSPTPLDYASVSGVGLRHVRDNLADYRLWVPQLLFSVGVFVPFVAAGWRSAPAHLRRATVFLLPVILVSSLMFSWLREARNFVPVIVPMAIIAAGALLPSTPTDEGARTPGRAP